MNLAYRDIQHKLGRFLLTCIGLSLLLGTVLSMIGIYRGLVDDALVLVRSPGADVWVVEGGTRGPFAESSSIPGNTREAVARMAGVAAAGSVTYQSIEAVKDGHKIRLYVVGYEPGRPGGPDGVVAGRMISRSHFELIADRRTGLALGDRLPLGRDTFTVIGLTENHVSSGGDPVVYMTLLDSQELQFDLEPGAARQEQARRLAAGQTPDIETDTVNAVIAHLEPYASATGVAADIQHWKHLSALTWSEQELLLTQSVVDRARKQIGLFTGILLTVSAVIIALIVYTTTMDKLREIATLKLIGAPNRTIIGLILQQAIAMGTTGFLVGAAIISLVKDSFPRRVVLDFQDGIMLAAVVLLVCFVASGLGVRLALKVEPAAALGG